MHPRLVTHTPWRRGAVILSLAGALGCSSSAASPDASPDVVADAALDAPPDVALDASPDVARDRQPGDLQLPPPADECYGLVVEDLGALGTVSGSVLRYTGDNRAAENSTRVGIQAGSNAQAACPQATTRQRIFRYVTRGAGSLRISTSNPGTDATFDTTLTVLPRHFCVANPYDLYCNDDDPTLDAAARNRATSLVVTPRLAAGQTVHIGVGGLSGTGVIGTNVGTFELTVEEVPSIAVGAACDRRGLLGACVDGASCVSASMAAYAGTCQRDASAPGAPCDAQMACASGLTCDVNTLTCFRAQADGMPCDRQANPWLRCGASSSCVNLQPGAVVGVCAPRGTVAGADCDSRGQCSGAGLTCAPTGSRPSCLYAATAGGACNTYDTFCPTGQTCVPTFPGQIEGTCQATGSVLGSPCAGTMCSGMGLTCNTGVAPATCFAAAAMAGEECSIWQSCLTGNGCYLVNTVDRARGRCFAQSAEGGPCSSTGACAAGLTCSNPTTPTSGRCLRTIAAGGRCQLFGTTRCATGTTCVHAGVDENSGTCVADGAEAGSACRATGSRCASGLTCTTATGAGVCQRASTDACVPRSLAAACPDGQSCRATSLDEGVCAAPAMETEPDDDPMHARAPSGAAFSVRGALTPFDIDCYGVDVPDRGQVFARVNLPNGTCASGQLALDLLDTRGRLLGSNTVSGVAGCPMIRGQDLRMPPVFAWARDLAAGRYTVCVRNPAAARGAVPDYVVDVSVTAGM